jgi:hypothetical protein
VFLFENDYLQRRYPISDHLNALLCQIWNPSPLRRVSVSGIKRALMVMDTFYTPDVPPTKARSPLPKVLGSVD